jgi:uncharacterized protein
MSILTILAVLIGIVIYTLICFYIGYNGRVWLKTTFLSKYKKTYISFIVLLSISFFAGQFIPLHALKMLGGLWMAIVGYSLILLPLANLLFYLSKKKGVFWIGLGVISFYLFIIIYGSYNAWNPIVRTYEVEVDKKSEEQDLKIFMVSYLHLGSLVGKNHLERLVDLVNEEKPDIVLIPGDIIDDYIEPYTDNNMGEIVSKIDAPLGVFAVTGNHDYYGDDMNELLKEMDKIEVRVLMDETVSIDNQFYIVGRKDLTDDDRKGVSELMKGLDSTKPIIMMDHQPFELEVAKNNGVDILLSGHTHRGQLAPANLITDWMYENDWGYLQKEGFHSFVSSGYGTWGPPLRIGSQSEVMVINVKFGAK